MQSKCGFELFEEKLNLPPQLVELDHVSQGEFLVVGHEDFLNLNLMALCRCFSCRKEEPYLSHGMNVSTFLVHVIRAGLEFRPDPVAGDPSIVDVLPLARMNLKANHLVGGQILRQRRDFGTWLLSSKNPLGVDGHDPTKLAFLAGSVDGLGVEGGVSQDHHARFWGQRQLADKLSGQFGLLAVRDLLRLAVGLGVVAHGKRQTHSAGGNQQAHHETVRRPLRVLLLLLLALLGALCFFAADDRVFGELTLLATVGLIDVEDERPLPRFHFEQLGTQLAEQIASPPIAASQESTDLSAMPRVGSNRAGNTGG